MNKITHDSESPAENQQVITACAFIHHDFEGQEKVFLPKRAESKKFLPGIYELPGGHIEFGEEMEVGLKREISEEFGMPIEVEDPLYVFTYTNDIKGSHSIEVIYFAKFTAPLTEITIDPDDHSEFGWFSEEEIMTKIVDENKRASDEEIKAILKGFRLLKERRKK